MNFKSYFMEFLKRRFIGQIFLSYMTFTFIFGIHFYSANILLNKISLLAYNNTSHSGQNLSHKHVAFEQKSSHTHVKAVSVNTKVKYFKLKLFRLSVFFCSVLPGTSRPCKILKLKNTKVWTGFIWLRSGNFLEFCDHGNEHSGSI